MGDPQIHEFYAIRLPNGQYLKKVNTNGSSLGVNSLFEALHFPSIEQAEGYVSQYLHRDANCLGVVKGTLRIEVVQESCVKRG